MTTYIVKLDKWASPVAVIAESALDAQNKTLKRYPTCDCCDDKVQVEYIHDIDMLQVIK